jgi:predicted nucleic acid-binding protein
MAGRLAAEFLRGIGNLTLISMDDSLAQAAAEIAADYALRGAEATYVAVARRHSCTLVSLDREQRERAAAIVNTRTPAEALAELQSPSTP